MNIAHIERQVLALLKSVHDIGIPSEVLTELASLAQAGEPGVALEDFCAQLYEYDVEVPAPMLATIRELGTAMGLADKHWKPLETTE